MTRFWTVYCLCVVLGNCELSDRLMNDRLTSYCLFLVIGILYFGIYGYYIAYCL